MNTTTCQQPGCTGSIQDGYCDVCGMAPASGSTAAPSAPAAAAGADGSACSQPGCAGSIEDGYCNVCGSPAGALASAPAAGPAPDATDPVSSGTASAKTSASRIQSAALGSRRAGTSATRRAGHGSQRMRAARLGAGLTVVPAAPVVDALKAVVDNPSVPEEKRTCSKCDSPIGRSSAGKPGRSEGFCPKCGQEFSFTPKLKAGDVVGGQYEVVGAIAHGGLGWIYLAKDRNVSNRWVVLKGLLNSGDPDALAAAIAEQQFLAQVEHPLIVEIYNFVTHEGAGYIVMEWVGGRSLKQILKQRMKDNKGAYDALPVDQALAYILEILPAFSYLHDLGLVYCDFKPDNLIQVGDAVKLIDMGGVRRITDEESAIFGTVGYQAPYLHTLPPPDTTPLFQQHDSLYQLIAKCCATDPADRFASAEELRTQLLGVLREVVASRTTGTALTSAASLLFEAPSTSASALDWSQLPALRADPSDPQHSWLTSVGDAEPADLLKALEQAPEDSAEVLLRRARASIELGDTAGARASTSQLLTQDPWEWRALWLDGQAAMRDQDWEAAKAAFSAVYQQVPGELGPKLALAIACENGELPEVAEGLYATCAATDAAYAPPAAFGMARVRAAAGDTAGAVRALDMVPSTSRGYPESRQLRADVLLAGAPGDLAVLDQALTSIASVRMDPAERQRYTVRILGHALDAVTKGGATPANARPSVGGVSAEEVPLRDALENAYRALAREADTLDSRVALVNQANAVRNKTLV